MEKLIIEKTVGYMLKAMKMKKKTENFHSEFAAIRHGNYYDFINLINAPIPTVVIYNHGNIKVSDTNDKEDIDFVGLIKSGPSLMEFHRKCVLELGDLIDKDIDDDIYEKLVLFEIGLRMHSNNLKILNDREKLEIVIDKICFSKNISDNDKVKLHQGRKFLNKIKHNKNEKINWTDWIFRFYESYSTLKKNDLQII